MSLKKKLKSSPQNFILLVYFQKLKETLTSLFTFLKNSGWETENEFDMALNRVGNICNFHLILL